MWRPCGTCGGGLRHRSGKRLSPLRSGVDHLAPARLQFAQGWLSLAARVGENPPKVRRYLASLMEELFVTQDRSTSSTRSDRSAPCSGSEPALLRLRETLEVSK